LEHEGDTLRLIPEGQAVQDIASPAERARVFRNWVEGLPKREGPPLPSDCLRRENLYD
jgi:hypothetical protein